MIIAVVSPHTSHNGNTLTSILTGIGLADLKKKVFLSHTSPVSESFYTYLGLKSFEDKTSTPTQLVKLIKQDAIKSDAISDYCKTVYDNLDVFTNDKPNFNAEDMLVLMQCVLTVLPYDFAVIDVDDNGSEVSDYVLSKADIIVINLTQSVMELNRFNAIKDKLMKQYQNKVIVLLCNQFSSTASKDKDVASKIGVKTKINVLHRNAWLQWGCNNGKLIDMLKQIKGKDPRVVEIGSDISSLANALVKAKTKVVQKQKANKTSK